MPQIRMKDAAQFLGVSDDTVRRWIDAGLLESEKDEAGRAVVDGLELAHLARSRTPCCPRPVRRSARSARNRFVGIVTDIIADTVMAQVELQCGPHRVVSLMSTEAVRELGLELGLGRRRDREGHDRHRRNTREGLTDAHPHLTARRCGGSGPALPSRACSPAARVRESARPAPRHADESRAASITVFAAASLTATFTELGRRVRGRHPGTTVDVQLRRARPTWSPRSPRARPADVFASADEANMKKVTDAGVTAGDPVDFATNVLAIAVPPGNPAKIKTFADLRQTRREDRGLRPAGPVRRGDGQGRSSRPGSRCTPVSEESSVTDVLGKVSSGEADAGIVYVTDVNAAGDGRSSRIPVPRGRGAP